MFMAKFISRNTGVSNKTGNPWYQLELIATTVDNGAKVLQTFCTAAAYNAAAEMQPMQSIRVACGVTDKGFLTVSAIKTEKGD